MNKDKIIQSAITAFLALATTDTVFAAQHDASPAEQEKCYSIVRAGMNDCSTATASCAGSATKDAQADAFIFLPKGVCAKLVGGQLNPPATAVKP